MALHKTPTGLPSGYAPDKHPGHWELHHIALPGDRPGDFTPIRRPDYVEENLSPLGELVEHVLDAVTGGVAPVIDREAE